MQIAGCAGTRDADDPAEERNRASPKMERTRSMLVLRKRLGMITPSSNSVLEPVTAAMLADVDGVTAHFSRFRVTEIALDAAALSQFDASVMLPAADLLADAKVDAIAWNGTSASWLGIGRDRSLCEAITARTGVPATTSTLACIDAARALGAKRVGLVSPYTDDVQRRIGDVWAEEGIDPHAERHLGLRDNFSFGEVAPATIAGMIRAVAADGADAVVILCTNLDGAALAASLERELDIAVLDSVAVTLWRILELAGGDAGALADWGRIFQTSTVIK
jgi:maleate isomerase